MDSELRIEPLWELIWWDIDRDVEFTSAVTGTPWQSIPNVERRKVQRMQGKMIHVLDEGLVVSKFSTRWEDGHIAYTTTWRECLICGKKFDVVAE